MTISSITVATPVTKLTIGGTVCPCTQFSINYPLNGLPNFQGRIAVGSIAIRRTQGDPDVSPWASIVEGALLRFELSIPYATNPTLIVFEGLVRNIQAESSNSFENGYATSLQITADHTLVKAAAYTVANRLLLPTGTVTTNRADPYRTKIDTGGLLTSLATVVNGLNLNQNSAIASSNWNALTHCMQVIQLLQENEESKSILGNQRVKDTAAMAEFAKIKVSGGMLKYKNRYSTLSNFSGELIRSAIANWGSRDALSIYLGMLNSVFCALSPRTDGSLVAQPYCAANKNINYTLNPSTIFAIKSSRLNPVRPIDGIVVKTYDKQNDSRGREISMYYYYPEQAQGASGDAALYEYVDATQFRLWFSVRQINMVEDAPKTQTGVKSTGVPGAPTAKFANKNNDESESAKMKARCGEVTKAIYGMKKWSTSSIVIQMRPNSIVQVGDRIKVDLTKVKALKETQFSKSVFIGVVSQVSFSGQLGNISMDIALSSVRSQEDNAKYGLDGHPLLTES